MRDVHISRAFALEPSHMPLVDACHVPQVALSFMNDDHHFEACLLNDLAEAVEQHRAGRATTGAVLERLDTLLAHTREHFAREESVMLESRFPSYLLHKSEHDRILEEMEAEARAFQEKGDVASLSAYVTEVMPTWFVQHIQSMDLVTSQFVAAREA